MEWSCGVEWFFGVFFLESNLRSFKVKHLPLRSKYALSVTLPSALGIPDVNMLRANTINLH